MTTPATGQGSAREKFEAWATDQGWRPVMRPSGVYEDWVIRELWNSWRGRDAEVLSSRRQALEEAAKVCECEYSTFVEGDAGWNRRHAECCVACKFAAAIRALGEEGGEVKHED